jgi:valyl-tRNA synthetase
MLKEANAQSRGWLASNNDVVATLARLSSIEAGDQVPPSSAQFVLNEATVALPLAGVIDLGKERSRLEKELKKAEQDIGRIDAKLANADFVSRAPQDVIDEQKERRAEAEAMLGRLKEAVGRLA